MNAKFEIFIEPHEFLPTKNDERAAWFKKFGIPASGSRVVIEASLEGWAAAGADIGVDGSVKLGMHTDGQLLQRLTQAICKQAREMGIVSELPVATIAAVFADAIAERQDIAAKKKQAAEKAVREQHELIDHLLENPHLLVQDGNEKVDYRTVVEHSRRGIPVHLSAEVRKERAADIETAEKAAAEYVKQRRAAIAAEKVALRNARRDFIVAHGDKNTLGRFDEEMLDEEELKAIMRGYFFEPLKDCERFERLTAEDIGCGCGGKVVGQVFSDPMLSASEYETLNVIRDFVDTIRERVNTWAHSSAVEMETRRHQVHCYECSEMKSRISVLISIDVLGYELSREYTL